MKIDVTTEKFKIMRVGSSRDLRTNVWTMECLNEKCKKLFQPPTTMLGTQIVRCPKCGASESINYNDIDIQP